MKINKSAIIILFLIFLGGGTGLSTGAAIESPQATVLISPRLGTFLVDNTFDVSFWLDTDKQNVQRVELDVKFPPDKLAIVRPSAGISFVSVWPEPPSYSNDDGRIKLVGLIPDGINTERGLFITITFLAKGTGQAVVEILPSSKILANDKPSAPLHAYWGRSVYDLNIKEPDGGIRVFSETHPFQGTWYNNNSPIFTWTKDINTTGFSYELDNKPLTIPDNRVDGSETIADYKNLGDGLWYFHVKSQREDRWGVTTHFSLRIDTQPPAPFQPKLEILTAEVIRKAMMSFFTTDALSGVDRYEVGVIDKKKLPLEQPFFIEAQSPYQLPNFLSDDLRVVVRARDRAGNVRDESVDIKLPFTFVEYFFKNPIIALVFPLFLLILLHFLFGHHIWGRLKAAWRLLRDKRQETGDEL